MAFTVCVMQLRQGLGDCGSLENSAVKQTWNCAKLILAITVRSRCAEKKQTRNQRCPHWKLLSTMCPELCWIQPLPQPGPEKTTFQLWHLRQITACCPVFSSVFSHSQTRKFPHLEGEDESCLKELVFRIRLWSDSSKQGINTITVSITVIIWTHGPETAWRK